MPSNRIGSGGCFPLTMRASVVAPVRLVDLMGQVALAARAVAHAAVPADPIPGINEPLSPYRCLATYSRPFEEIHRVTTAFRVTVNDVVLNAVTGAMSRLLVRRGLDPGPLKAMVPVNVRTGADQRLGNRFAPVFVEFPCDEPDPVERLGSIHTITLRGGRQARQPSDCGVAPLREPRLFAIPRRVARLSASSRPFNLSVSNVRGPAQPLFMLGCRLREVYPAVPLAQGHPLSIGFMSDGRAWLLRGVRRLGLGSRRGSHRTGHRLRSR